MCITQISSAQKCKQFHQIMSTIINQSRGAKIFFLQKIAEIISLANEQIVKCR